MVEIETTEKKIEETVKAEPRMATISFDIPAYQNKDGTPFKRELTVPTKKAYAIYMKLVKKEFVK